MILDLVYYDDPRLRKRCDEVKEITPEIKELCQNMIETMQARNGAALAAPQVGAMVRIFVNSYTGTDKEGNPVMGSPVVYINPKITAHSENEVLMEEGCLSIPGLYTSVWRPEEITITAQDVSGKSFTETISGWRARAILHENDHLNGVLFIDRLDRQAKKRLKSSLQKIKNKYQP